MGTIYPYASINKDNVTQKANKFYKKFAAQFKEIKRLATFSNNGILVPLGGDQAPIMRFLPEFIRAINKLDTQNE
jgi:alpha-mannosidase